MEGEQIIVVATSGDARLGGGDFDDAIVEWAVDELREHHRLDVRDDPRARARIKLQAEQAKVRASTFQSTTLPLAELRPHEPPVLTLTRDRLEGLIRNDLNRTLHSVEEALAEAAQAGIGREQLSGVLLVGGSTKIPMVKRMLAGFFGRGDDFVKLDLDPAAVVARGAAIMASRYTPNPPPFDLTAAVKPSFDEQDAEKIVEVTPITEHSLSAGVVGDRCVRLIARGERIPASQKRSNFTNEGPSDSLILPVYQGESEWQPENTCIGSVILDGLEPKPKGFHHFEVKYTLDENGLLSVEVTHTNTGKLWSQLQLRYRVLHQLYAPARAYAPPGPEPPEPAADVGAPPPSWEDEQNRAGRHGG